MSRQTCSVLFVALFAPSLLSAQSITLGSKVGVNHATWVADFGVPYSVGMYNGLVVGPFASIGFRELVAVQIEALYSRKGATGAGDFRMTQTYLETPILLRVALPLWPLPVRAIAMAGVAPAWELSCSAVAQGPSIPEAPPAPAVAQDCIGWRTERRDVSRVTAVGIEIPIGRLRVTAEFRQAPGRVNIAQGYAPLSTYNRVHAFLIGIAYSVRR